MANRVNVRNIIVGHGNLWFSDYGTALPATASSSSEFGTLLDSASDWTYLGATRDGVEVTYEPDYGEIEIDQLKDAARVFNQGLSVSVSTMLAEATLENLLVAWGLPDDAHTDNGADGVDEFKIGVPDEDPVERSLAVVGPAPLKYTSPGVLEDTAGGERERIYHALRVVSLEGSSFSLKRSDVTEFPVSFKVLPDDAVDDSEAYGKIYDRYVS